MTSANSYLKAPSHRSKASDSRQAWKIDGVSGFNSKAVNNPKSVVGEAIKTNSVAQMNLQTKQPVAPVSLPVDHTKLFTTNLNFNTSDEAMAWVIRVGKVNQTEIVKYRFNETGKGKVRSFWMYCERHGSVPGGMSSWKRGKEVSTASKICNCPFSLKCYQVDQGPWKVEVECGWHIHEIGQSPHGHTHTYGRWTEERKQLFASHCNPKQVLPHIKDKDPANVTCLKEVYNARDKLLKGDLGGRTILQQFLSLPWVAQRFYYMRHRDAPGVDGRSSDLVFALSDSLRLLRAFPYVLIVDATFQGNRFNAPFFEVRGVASTWRSFNVACAFVAAEREENYVWALNHIKDLCWLAGKTPTTIVTVSDPDQALFNAVEQVFPNSKHLLCRHHIYRIIQDRCLEDPGAYFFVSACKTLFESKTEKMYEERLAFMENDWKSKQGLIWYLKQTWLTPYKDRIVSAWTDKVRHFGTHDTVLYSLNYLQDPMRVGSLSLVKDHLNCYFGSDAWGFLHALLDRQAREINGTFRQSQQELPYIVPRVDLFRLLQHGISHKAIEIMVQEYKHVTSGDWHPSICVCQLRATHGLPCAHEMAKYVAEHRPIPRDAIHEFWRQVDLDVEPDDPQSDAAHVSTFIDLLLELPYMSAWERQVFKQIIIERKRLGKRSPANLLWSEGNTTPLGSSSSETSGSEQSDSYSSETLGLGQAGSSSSETLGLEQSHMSSTSPTSSGQGRSCPVQSIERSKPSNKSYVEEPYIHIIPNFLVPYVMDFCEYVDNGHCAFEAIAAEGLENGWRLVREDLFKDLATNSYVYANVFASHTIETMLKALAVWTTPAYLPEQRFSIPDMGHIVASYYQLVFVVLGQQCVTFLPLYVANDTDLSNMDELCLVSLQQGRKFIKVTMDKGFPLPPAHPSWAHHHLRSANGLDWRYHDRFQKYKWFQSFMEPSFLHLKL